MDYIREISPRPILFIAGDRAHSKGFSERAYEMAAKPKELYIVEDAEYIDLYDRVDRIPFDKLDIFFKENLKQDSKTSRHKIGKGKLTYVPLVGADHEDKMFVTEPNMGFVWDYLKRQLG